MKALSETDLIIVGTGLMGTSLALALHEKVKSISGVEANPITLKTAALAFDRISADLASVATADVIILAVPVRTIITLLEPIKTLAKPGALILDLGSAKAAIVTVMDSLPDHLLAIGGHPMAGKENSGPQNADAAIYRNCRFVLCPTQRTTPEALRFAESMIATIGAYPILLNPRQHDEAVAAISHLPYLLSVSLVEMVVKAASAEGADTAWQLASSGFRDTSRLAASDVTMMFDTVLANREAVLKAIDAFQDSLTMLRRELVFAPESSLRDTLEQIRQARRDWSA